MTSVAYIHGPAQRGRQQPPADEWGQRAALAQRPAVRWRPDGRGTVGGNRLILAADQLQLLSSFYPDDKQLAVDYRALTDALEQGLSNGAIKLPHKTSAYVRALVAEARGLMRPEGAGVGGLIPLDDCSEYEWGLRPLCRNRNAEITLLNTYLEPSSPHLLYNFVANPNAATPVVATKTVLHKAAADAMAAEFQFDRMNLSIWLRNGVMRSNANQNIPPVSPEQSIELMRKAAEPAVGIDPVTLALVAGILKAVVAAIGATGALMATMKAAKRAKIEAQARGMATASFGPQEGDWTGASPQGGGGQGENTLKQLLPFGLLAGAGLLLLSE